MSECELLARYNALVRLDDVKQVLVSVVYRADLADSSVLGSCHNAGVNIQTQPPEIAVS